LAEEIHFSVSDSALESSAVRVASRYGSVFKRARFHFLARLQANDRPLPAAIRHPRDNPAATGKEFKEDQAFVLPLFEIARVLVRFDHVARFIANANHSVM